MVPRWADYATRWIVFTLIAGTLLFAGLSDSMTMATLVATAVSGYLLFYLMDEHVNKKIEGHEQQDQPRQ